MEKRPGLPTTLVVHPNDGVTIALLGGESYAGVTFTPDQHRALRDLYEVSDEVHDVERWRSAHDESQAQIQVLADKNPFKPVADKNPFKPVAFDEKGFRAWKAAGEDINVMRRASLDGLRLIGLLAKFLEPGEDPVRYVHDLLIDAGLDVDAWGDDEEEV